MVNSYKASKYSKKVIIAKRFLFFTSKCNQNSTAPFMNMLVIVIVGFWNYLLSYFVCSRLLFHFPFSSNHIIYIYLTEKRNNNFLCFFCVWNFNANAEHNSSIFMIDNRIHMHTNLAEFTIQPYSCSMLIYYDYYCYCII